MKLTADRNARASLFWKIAAQSPRLHPDKVTGLKLSHTHVVVVVASGEDDVTHLETILPGSGANKLRKRDVFLLTECGGENELPCGACAMRA